MTDDFELQTRMNLMVQKRILEMTVAALINTDHLPSDFLRTLREQAFPADRMDISAWNARERANDYCDRIEAELQRISDRPQS